MGAHCRFFYVKMAERRGFEPPDGNYPVNRLAGGCLQPLGHLSPTSESVTGIQDSTVRRLRGQGAANPRYEFDFRRCSRAEGVPGRVGSTWMVSSTIWGKAART